MSSDVTVEPSAALLIIDVQKAMDDPRWGRRNNPDLLPNLQRVIVQWRKYERPVVLIADDEPNPNSPHHPGQPGNDLKPEVAPVEGDRVVRKTTGNAFAGTDLEEMLRAAQVETLVVGGFMTNKCVSATVSEASKRGFQVLVLSDATATVGEVDPSGGSIEAEEVQRRALEEMQSKTVRIAQSCELVGTGGVEPITLPFGSP